MTTATTCPDCDAPLPADAPEGLCPRCLLRTVVADNSAATHRMGQTKVEVGARLRYLGDYELLDEIARGGMGVVFKARQVTLNRTVALKMILAGQLASAQEIERFLVEAEAAANLQHPNIVAIHEVGRHGDQHYFSMDYVEGTDLATKIAAERPGIADCAALAETLARAVAYAHAQGTLHRDLKAQNVLIDREGRPRITDFGLAKRMDDDSQLTAHGSVLGSPSTMPPEQALGRQAEIGPASDVYGLGAVLYHMLTGRPPFVGETVAETLQQVREQPPLPPSRINGDVPRDLETICLKCLEKAPGQRYESAQALADDLERFRNHQPITARRAGLLRRVVDWSHRRPWAICGMLALLLVACAALGYGLYEQNRLLRHEAVHGPVVHDPTLDVPRDPYGFPLMALLGLAIFDSLLRARRIRWSVALRGQADLTQPIVKLPRPAVWAYGALGAFGVLGVLALIAGHIHAWVWRGAMPIDDLVLVVTPCAFMSFLLLAVVVHELQVQVYGVERVQQEPARVQPEQLVGKPLLDRQLLLRNAGGLLLAAVAVVALMPAPSRMAMAVSLWAGACFGGGMLLAARPGSFAMRWLKIMPFAILGFAPRQILIEHGTGDWITLPWMVSIVVTTAVLQQAYQAAIERIAEEHEQGQVADEEAPAA